MPYDGTNFEIKQQDEVLDVLRRARAQIATPGLWCRGAAEVGAAKCASHWIYEMSEAALVEQAHAALWRAMPVEWTLARSALRVVVTYNDYPGRTQGEIVALYDAAIAILERGA